MVRTRQTGRVQHTICILSSVILAPQHAAPECAKGLPEPHRALKHTCRAALRQASGWRRTRTRTRTGCRALQLPCTMSSSKGSQRCRLRRTGPSAGGGRRAVGARSRAAAAALRLDLLHGPALDRPAVDEAGREALRGSMAKVGGTQGRGACVRLCGVWYVVCMWCVAAAAEKARAHQRDHAGHRCEGAVHPDHSAVLRHPTPPVSGLTRVASPLHPSPLITPCPFGRTGAGEVVDPVPRSRAAQQGAAAGPRPAARPPRLATQGLANALPRS